MAALDQATTTTASETQPILISTGNSQQCMEGEKRLKPWSRFRLPLISEKGAILMIVWNVFFAMSLFSARVHYVHEFSGLILLFLFPIVGWLVDSKLGRYRVLQAALYFLLASIVLSNLSELVFQNSIILRLGSTAVGILATLCYVSCIIPFVMDHMVGASGEELSFTSYWLVWGAVVGLFTSNMLDGTGVIAQTASILNLAVSSASFLIAFSLLTYFSHLLNTKPQLANPIKLITQVLNYARKHKYPERRSALTYWEEDYPSRIDLGKEKYGGPFSFEQVEDVKTVLRLLPLVAIIVVTTIGVSKSISASDSDYNWGTYNVKNHQGYALTLAATIAALPVYHFIVYPLFYNCIPTLLKRIGLAICFACVGCISNALVQYVNISEESGSNNATCMLFSVLNISDMYVMIYAFIPMFFNMLSLPIFAYFTLELIVAQTPHQIKGFVLCITVELYYIIDNIASGSFSIFYQFVSNIYPSCGFYYYIVLFIITTIAFFAYLYGAKKYKLRVRDDIVPVHRLAEEYFEKDEKLRKAYRKELGFGDSNQSI